MDAEQKAVAQACLEAAEADTKTFPQIVSTLVEAGFESYFIDFRRAMTFRLRVGAGRPAPPFSPSSFAVGSVGHLRRFPPVPAPPGKQEVQALSLYLGGFRFPECRKAPHSLRGAGT
jgi:hypothetical protein